MSSSLPVLDPEAKRQDRVEPSSDLLLYRRMYRQWETSQVLIEYCYVFCETSSRSTVGRAIGVAVHSTVWLCFVAVEYEGRAPSVQRSEPSSAFGKLQAARPAEIDPVAATPVHDAQEDRFAVGASDHGSRRVDVDLDPADRIGRTAVPARGLGRGHLHREDLSQQTADRVAVELQLGLQHRHPPPVAPKRSVLT